MTAKRFLCLGCVVSSLSCQPGREEEPILGAGPGEAAPSEVVFRVVNDGPGPIFWQAPVFGSNPLKIRPAAGGEALRVNQNCTECTCSSCVSSWAGCAVCLGDWGRVVLLEPGDIHELRWNYQHWTLEESEGCDQPCLRRWSADITDYRAELRYATSIAPSAFLGEIDLRHTVAAGVEFTAYVDEQVRLPVSSEKLPAPDAWLDVRSESSEWTSPYVYATPFSDDAVGIVGVANPNRSLVLFVPAPLRIGVFAAEADVRVGDDAPPGEYEAWRGEVEIDELSERYVHGTFELIHPSQPTYRGSFTAAREGA